MSDLFSFYLQVVLLLVVPGPTNTLLCLSGRDRGVAGSIPLMFGEAAGYLAVVVPMVLFLSPVFMANPPVVILLKSVAVCWILYLAVALWRAGTNNRDGGAVPVTLERVFVTTLLNPKAILFGLVVFTGGKDAPIQFALFLSALLPVALLWMFVGATVSKIALLGSGGTMNRIAASCLFLFSAVLAKSALLG